MMIPCVQTDSNYKAHMSACGYLIYIACDNSARQVLNQPQNNTTHTLRKDTQDGTRKKLIENKISVLERDSDRRSTSADRYALSEHLMYRQGSRKYKRLLEMVQWCRGVIRQHHVASDFGHQRAFRHHPASERCDMYGQCHLNHVPSFENKKGEVRYRCNGTISP